MLFENATQFSLFIESRVAETGQSYLDAILEFCEDSGAEYDSVASLISSPLKQKIYEEATSTYSMPRETAVRLDES